MKPIEKLFTFLVAFAACCSCAPVWAASSSRQPARAEQSDQQRAASENNDEQLVRFNSRLAADSRLNALGNRLKAAGMRGGSLAGIGQQFKALKEDVAKLENVSPTVFTDANRSVERVSLPAVEVFRKADVGGSTSSPPQGPDSRTFEITSFPIGDGKNEGCQVAQTKNQGSTVQVTMMATSYTPAKCGWAMQERAGEFEIPADMPADTHSEIRLEAHLSYHLGIVWDINAMFKTVLSVVLANRLQGPEEGCEFESFEPKISLPIPYVLDEDHQDIIISCRFKRPPSAKRIKVGARIDSTLTDLQSAAIAYSAASISLEKIIVTVSRSL